MHPSNSSLTGQRVLVTGANGFIGSHLSLRLHRDGAEVHGVYRSHPPVSRTHNWWQADLSDLAAVKELFAKARPDVIFHLASHVKGAPDLEHVLPTFHSNLHTTVNLLTVASSSNCRRVILTGSLAEPEPHKGELFPSAPYAAAKSASSAYARMFHALYKLPVLIARVFMVYGPGQRDLTKLIPYSILSLLRGEPPQITSGGRLVDWIYISDVVNGFIALAQAGDVDGQTLDLGSGALVSIRDIVKALTELAAPSLSAQFGILPDRPLEPTRLARTSETLTKIGWRPEVSLAEGLRHTLEWYRAEFYREPERYFIAQP
jgi:nucleoside-diphosphate-sugar epimerase